MINREVEDSAKMKRHLFYTFLLIFIATSVITLLGIVDVVEIKDEYLSKLIVAFLIELSGGVVFVYKQADFFGNMNNGSGRPLEISRPLSSPPISSEVVRHEMKKEIAVETNMRTETLNSNVAPDDGQSIFKSFEAFVKAIRNEEKQTPALEFQISKVSKRYQGVRISWVMQVASIEIKGENLASIRFIGDGVIASATGVFSIDKRPELKLLKNGDKCKISGTLDVFNDLFNVAIQFDDISLLR